jgi:hypothetical protein
LDDNWDPKTAGDKVLQNLVQVTMPPVKGTHDGRFVIIDDKAYIVYYANDNRPGEDPRWNDIYIQMSVLNIKTMEVMHCIPVAKGGQAYDNYTLEKGACFVPYIFKKDKKTLRCFFASEEPGKRQSQTWYIDFNIKSSTFSKKIFKAKILTNEGVFEMLPKYFYQHALSDGYISQGYVPDYGLYIFDMKPHLGKTYVSLVMFPWGPSGLTILNKEMDTFEIIGCIKEPFNEMAICFMPNNQWLSVLRNDKLPYQYVFKQSPDGRNWAPIQGDYFEPKGSPSKPTLDCFNGVYYLGWQSSEKINDVNRSVFIIDVSRDGITWETKYRFETEKSFQYPFFQQYKGRIWFVVTQGDYSPDRKERIMFGCLEKI